MNSHAQRLWYSSAKWMKAAFAAFSSGPMMEDMAVHHAGVSAEHLLKAYLASLHPSLVVEASHFDSMLWATGHGAYAGVPATQTRTIGLVEAHKRVWAVMKGEMPVTAKELGPLANARNGVAHAALHDAMQVDEVFTTFLRLADAVLPRLPLTDFWGQYKGLHDKLLDVRVERARVRLEGMLVRARQAFAGRYEHLSEQDRLIVLAAVSKVSSPGYMEHDEIVSCPACPATGWLGGETYVSPQKQTVMMTPTVFDCPACDLHLEREELGMLASPHAADIDLGIAPEDFYMSAFAADELEDASWLSR
ncbi:hypothetical protein [Streptomyces sp. WL006]|uniref:hypothetical protein n=1 Tax=Streptomyces sp. WL006 TaxID=3423915 RepID=UPI003F6CC89A